MKHHGTLRHPLRNQILGLLAGGLTLLGAASITIAAEPPKPAANGVQPPTVTPQQAEFFETHVRPLLFNKCFGCHAEKAQQGGLRLDSLDAMLKGGGGGPVLVPGNVDKSRLLTAIHYSGALKMPPGGKLKDDEIATLTDWVKMGAPWPNAKISDAARAAQRGEYVLSDAQKNFWSFQPVKSAPSLPSVKNSAWVKSPIDRFILAKLEAKGLKPALPADRRTLIRRANFDLIGLPPTPEEIDAFVADKSPDAFARVVDRLLASPHYGERWARHWLDVARYADTKGYVFTEDPNFYNAYTYRDYVVKAFNSDLPYDQFVTQQLAADLAYPDNRPAQAAMGFITVGRRFLNDGQLINDDRIDVTARGLMGLTVACARCHDHKFDPISNKDYYAMYSVFDRTAENTVPVSPAEQSRPYEEYQQKLNAAQSETDRLTREQIRRLRGMVMKSPDSVPAKEKAVLQSLREDQLPTPPQYATIAPLFESAARDRVTALQATIADLNKHIPPKPDFGMAMKDNGNNNPQRVFVRGNINNQGDVVPRRFLTCLSLSGEKPLPPTGSGRLELARYITSIDNPLTARVFVNRVWLNHFGYGLVRTPSDFGIRGERPTHPELLDWLAYNFMEGTGNKEPGTGKSAPDTRPWSIKNLQRMILLSSAYQMSSDATPAVAQQAFTTDPENRLLWRQNRQRLDLESLRDSLLFVSGKLDAKLGGPAVELTTMPYTTRRTLYGYINRNNLQGLYRTFDFASPDQSAAQRINTSVPQQALYLMNSPFVVQQAQALAGDAQLTASKEEAARIRNLYRRMFGRVPTADEVTLGVNFLRQPLPGAPEVGEPSPWKYGWGTYDPQTGHVVGFAPFAHFSGQQWQGSATFPDPKLSFLSLNAQGGHPGPDMQHVVVRRWISPIDGFVSIDGALNHPSDKGDGVQGRICLTRLGELGMWKAFHGSVATPVAKIVVQKGDAIDFVVDCNKEQSFDAFVWMPTIHAVSEGAKLASSNAPSPQSWNAREGFSGPAVPPPAALSNWERYIQALLMTNEFNFVD